MDFTFEDNGLGNNCPIKVTYDNDIDHKYEVWYISRDNKVEQQFGRTIGSNKFDAVCSSLIDGKLALYSKTTSWFNQSHQIAVLDLNGVNGHNITVNISKAAA